MTLEELMKEASIMPAGWYSAFGEEMVEELFVMLYYHDLLDEYEVLQVKEKFGGLRWYGGGFSNFSEEALNQYELWLKKYEKISEKTCIMCGAPGRAHDTLYSAPLCQDCDIEIFI